MELSLIKFASLLTEKVSNSPDFLKTDKTFKRLIELIPKAENDLLTAWTGDIKEFQRSGGKNFQSLFAIMVTPDNLKRKYNAVDNSELRSITGNLSNLAHHAFSNAPETKYSDDAYKWGNQWQKESLETLEQDMRYVELREEFFPKDKMMTEGLSDNRYYRVEHPITVWKSTGYAPTNHYYGASRLHRATWKEYDLETDDEIHDLVGGLFAVQVFDDGAQPGFRIRLTPPESDADFSPFEKNYGGSTGGTPNQRVLGKLLSSGRISKLDHHEKTHASYKSS